METDTSRAIDAVRAGLREVESCLFVPGDACYDARHQQAAVRDWDGTALAAG
jgi:hypothetical protein